MGEDCLICAKQRGAGPLVPGSVRVWEDDLLVVWHAPSDFLGHLILETKRHTPYLADLSPEEAAAVGRDAARAARAARAECGAEYVFSAVIGRGAAHFHQHVFPRYPGTPDDVPWYASDEWEGAPRGDADQIEALCLRLANHFE